MTNEEKINEEVLTKYIFETTTQGKFKIITLTNFMISKGVFKANYSLANKDWAGTPKDITNVIAALTDSKLTAEALEEGFTVVYMNGKHELFKDE